ncbi:MAG TPA: M28 family metallopeptidase [Bryobacteraceae bacterium]|nr:M28 family metallopeptidase [Bryobacteraceae bacterium]
MKKHTPLVAALCRLLPAALAALALAAAPSAGDGRRWWSYVKYLADDKLEGRNTGSEGYRKAAAYVAGEFERAGLKAAGTGGYFQPVKFRTRRILETGCGLELLRHGAAEPLALGEDAVISTRIDPAPRVEAGLVFAGYGLTVPEMHYDDLAGLDLRGKIVVYLAGSPGNISGPLRAHYQSAPERGRFLERAGVLGAIAIPDPHHMDIPWARMALSRFQTSMSLAASGAEEDHGLRFAATWNPARAEKLLAGTGHTFEELQALADAGKPLPRFPLPVSLRAKVEVERAEVESPNVVALLPGADPALENEYVVLSAHLDHLGVGEPIQGDPIYNGAMDDASGVATLLDIAAALHHEKARLRRSVLFLAVTGEEKGLLGSRYFATHPTVDTRHIVADLNVDMFLPLYPLHLVTVYGLEESDLGDHIREVAAKLGIGVQEDPEPQRNSFIRSDQYSFIRSGVPSLAFKDGYRRGTPEEKIFKTWLRERYHAPSDDLCQPVDLQAAADFNRLVRMLAESVANDPQRPHWKAASFFRRFAD